MLSPKQSRGRELLDIVDPVVTYPTVALAVSRAGRASPRVPYGAAYARRLRLPRQLSKYTQSVSQSSRSPPPPLPRLLLKSSGSTRYIAANNLVTNCPRRAQLGFSFSQFSSRLLLVARHAAGGLGAAVAGGEHVGAGDEPAAGGGAPPVGPRDEPAAGGAVRGRVAVGEGAGDRAEAGRDARDAARPPRVRLRALPHRPRREDRGCRGRKRRRRCRGQQRRPGPSAATAALAADAAEREEGADSDPKPAGDAGRGRAVRVRQARRAAGGGEDREAGLLQAAGRQREREREEQLPQQQRRSPAQLLHAPLHHTQLHPQLHLAAPQPRRARPCRHRRRRPRRLQQEGERLRHRQVLADAVGPAVAEVEPAGPGRRVGGDPGSGEPPCSRRERLKKKNGHLTTTGCIRYTRLRFCTYIVLSDTVWLFGFLLVVCESKMIFE